jgi:hypothetical protein
MNELVLSCESFGEYPKNILRCRTNDYQRNELNLILGARDHALHPLFDSESNASVVFWDFGADDNGLSMTLATRLRYF